MVYDYEYFKKQVFALTKIDLNCYKEKQMKRRIDTLISRHNLDGYDAFLGKEIDYSAIAPSAGSGVTKISADTKTENRCSVVGRICELSYH